MIVCWMNEQITSPFIVIFCHITIETLYILYSFVFKHLFMFTTGCSIFKLVAFICLHCFSCLVFLAFCEWFSRGLFDLNHERLILTLFISLDVFVAIEWRIETHLRWDWRCVSFCCFCVLILKKQSLLQKSSQWEVLLLLQPRWQCFNCTYSPHHKR